MKYLNTLKSRKEYKKNLTIPSHQIECSCCGDSLTIAEISPGQSISCPTCKHRLVRIEKNPITTPIALSITSFFLFLIMFIEPFIEIDLKGLISTFSIKDMLINLTKGEFNFLALNVFLLITFTPLLFCLLTFFVYISILYQKNSFILLPAARIIIQIKNWMMLDIFFISTLVAAIKIISLAQIIFHISFWVMLLLSIVITRTSQSISRHFLFYQIQLIQLIDPLKVVKSNATLCCSNCLFYQPQNRIKCKICGSTLYSQKPNSLKNSLYLLIASIILYIPASLLPIMITSNPISSGSSTIFEGVVYMWNTGDKFIAIIIFSASIGIPMFKIFSLLYLILITKFQKIKNKTNIYHLYEITELLGRWSMIDVFVIIVLMSSFYTPLAKVEPGEGVVYFSLVVIFTMISADKFDPKLIWQSKRTS